MSCYSILFRFTDPRFRVLKLHRFFCSCWFIIKLTSPYDRSQSVPKVNKSVLQHPTTTNFLSTCYGSKNGYTNMIESWFICCLTNMRRIWNNRQLHHQIRASNFVYLFFLQRQNLSITRTSHRLNVKLVSQFFLRAPNQTRLRLYFFSLNCTDFPADLITFV